MRALHATVLSRLGPARKHTAKFEPAAWSWAQMTSGFGAPIKRVRRRTRMSPLVITHRRRGPRLICTLSLACVCSVVCIVYIRLRAILHTGHGTRSLAPTRARGRILAGGSGTQRF